MMKVILKYSLFALISIIVNIGTQNLILYLFFPALDQTLKTLTQNISHLISYNDIKLWIAIIFGTGTGLITKYLMDKKYIFYYPTETKKEDTRLFLLYSLMGIITTAIFWGNEWLFHFLIDAPWGKDLGAVLGLCIGYFVKYNLDKKYVFSSSLN